MTIIIGHDHHYNWNSMITYNYITNQIEDGEGNKIEWVTSEHLDKRKRFLTLFNYDPYTGKKIDLKMIKYLLSNHIKK